jgi:ABC-type nitrate/sulfonate/bicarbonate transport system substrate-binding protein
MSAWGSIDLAAGKATTMTHPHSTTLAAAIFAVLLIAGSSSAADKLSALYSAQSVSYSLPWIAREAGLFRKYNLDFQLVYIPSSGIATTALIGGDVEIAMAGGVGTIRAFVQGANDLVFIGGFKNILTHSLVAKPEIAKAEDLRGTKIGITRLGSNSHYFAVQALRRMKLDPVRDVTFIQAGGEPEIAAALIGGSIDAGSITSPADNRAIAQGFRYLLYGPDLQIAYSAANIATRRSTIAKRPQVGLAFMQAMAEAAKILHTNRDFTYKAIGKQLGISDMKIIDAAFATEIKVMERRLDLKPEGVQAILDEVVKTDPRAKNFKPQDLTDRRYLDEMTKSGFFDKLWAAK